MDLCSKVFKNILQSRLDSTDAERSCLQWDLSLRNNSWKLFVVFIYSESCRFSHRSFHQTHFMLIILLLRVFSSLNSCRLFLLKAGNLDGRMMISMTWWFLLPFSRWWPDSQDCSRSTTSRRSPWPSTSSARPPTWTSQLTYFIMKQHCSIVFYIVNMRLQCR